MQVWAIIVDSFREAKDRKIFWIMIALSGMVAACMFCISFNQQGLDVLFGTFTFEIPNFPTGGPDAKSYIASIMVHAIADSTMGWIGIILTLIATASTFPTLMERGSIDITLAKPITRTKLFLAKYAAAMVFVLVQAAIFVALTFLVAGIRWQFWMWTYWWFVPLFVLLFSYIFCFCALFAMITRRTVPALLLTLFAWILIMTPQALRTMLETDTFPNVPPQWRRLATGAYWIVPKTQDVPIIAAKLMNAAPATDAFVMPIASSDAERHSVTSARDAEQRITDELSIVKSVGSSLASEAAVVAFALLIFRRRDF